MRRSATKTGAQEQAGHRSRLSAPPLLSAAAVEMGAASEPLPSLMPAAILIAAAVPLIVARQAWRKRRKRPHTVVN
ncbi:MAG: hypothetical protein DI547_07345 [Sphingobium sp.]|nr:MAG: hypothetical protein DI547_07345 [Sphingobium sp.]